MSLVDKLVSAQNTTASACELLSARMWYWRNIRSLTGNTRCRRRLCCMPKQRCLLLHLLLILFLLLHLLLHLVAQMNKVEVSAADELLLWADHFVQSWLEGTLTLKVPTLRVFFFCFLFCFEAFIRNESLLVLDIVDLLFKAKLWLYGAIQCEHQRSMLITLP